MFSDPVFPNAFVVDGIIPERYGLRTVVEYRSRLYSVPHYDRLSHPPTDDHMDIITPTPQKSLRPMSPPEHQQNSAAQAPDPQQGEHALRHLASGLDLSSLGALNPIMFSTLRVVPPAYVRISLLAEKRKQSNDQKPASYVQSTLNKLRTIALRGEPKRDTEPSLLSWHWGADILAIATGAELDRICAYNFVTSEWELPGERHHAIFNIRALAFRPYGGRTLAIACHRGVALLDGQRLEILPWRTHTNIISVDWSADGQYVASASAADGSVRLWDVATRLSIKLCTGSFVKFSPAVDSKMLFIADATAVNFKLWDCRTQSFERWGSLSGPVVAATWSSDGRILAFSTQGQSCIHVLSVGTGVNGVSESTMAHVEMTALPREGPGGTPIQLEFDPTGERLAAIYEVPDEDVSSADAGAFPTEDSHRRFVVALYAVQLRSTFGMTPIGYVSGPEGSGPPIAIKFKPRPIAGAGAMLSCMWRNGEISFTHLFFNASRS